jgi:hypothetical protein
MKDLNYWYSFSPCSVNQLLKSFDKTLSLVTVPIRPMEKRLLCINDNQYGLGIEHRMAPLGDFAPLMSQS